MIEWADGSITRAETAEGLIAKLCGGWNPPTIPETAKVLARRAFIPEPDDDEPMTEFLERLDAAGMLVYTAD